MKNILKNTKRFMIVVAVTLLVGLCTAGIIKAAAIYDYGSAVPSQKLYFANRKEIFSIFGAKSEVFLP